MKSERGEPPVSRARTVVMSEVKKWKSEKWKWKLSIFGPLIFIILRYVLEEVLT